MNLKKTLALIVFACILSITISSCRAKILLDSKPALEAVIEETAERDFDDSIINKLNQLKGIEYWSIVKYKSSYTLWVDFGIIKLSFRDIKDISEMNKHIDRIPIILKK